MITIPLPATRKKQFGRKSMVQSFARKSSNESQGERVADVQLNLDGMSFRHDPYPIGCARGVFDEQTYDEMIARWPAMEMFRYKPSLGKKYSLSEVNHAKRYHDFVQATPVWKAFHDYVKSEQFVAQVIDVLWESGIDLGLRDQFLVVNRAKLRFRQRIDEAVRAFRFRSPRTIPLKSRFEFSMLPADGGSIRPHTDGVRKLMTLIIPVMRAEEWNDDFGGGTLVLQPKDKSRNYNLLNEYLEFDETESIGVFPYRPNQCILFVKTFNSLHAVAPMTGSTSPLFRRTLTINIEMNA